ncbi:MAG: ATP-binding protein [Pirellulales bacterium]|nr:ATP-binding protein [Pirellulales bacterium]
MTGSVISIPLPGETLDQRPRESVGLDWNCYFCGPENRLAEYVLNRILAWMIPSNGQEAGYPASADPFPINPLVFFGPTGCGKTHMARGLYLQWRASFGADEAVYSTAIDFARSVTSADDASSRTHLLKSFCRPSLVVLDDLDKFPNRPSLHWGLRRVMDTIANQGGLLIATSSAAPECILCLPPAIRSRLAQGSVIPIALPGVAVRRELARRLAHGRGMTLTDRELSAVAGSFDVSPRSIARRLNHLERSRNSRDVDYPSRTILDSSDDPGQIDKPLIPILPTITATIARYFKLTPWELKSQSRRHTIVHARGIAMYLARELTDTSLSKIGHEFGNRDHSTVLHACRKIADLISRDETTRTTVAELSRILMCA